LSKKRSVETDKTVPISLQKTKRDLLSKKGEKEWVKPRGKLCTTDQDNLQVKLECQPETKAKKRERKLLAVNQGMGLKFQ